MKVQRLEICVFSNCHVKSFAFNLCYIKVSTYIKSYKLDWLPVLEMDESFKSFPFKIILCSLQSYNIRDINSPRGFILKTT